MPASYKPSDGDLVVVNCTKRYHGAGHEVFTALDGMNLTVARGTVVSIVGSNGAGKSTLLSIVSGNVLPDAGRVIVRGADITSLPSWKRVRTVARVRQNPEFNMLSALTIEENFTLALARGRGRFGLRIAGGQHVRNAARDVLAPLGMGLEKRLGTITGALSGGQRQAMAVAMASIGEPAVLLLDEHVAALDPNSARRVNEITDELVRKANITTLMVTHDMGHALERSDRLIMLHAGRIVLDIDRRLDAGLSIQDLHDRFAALVGQTLPDETLLSS